MSVNTHTRGRHCANVSQILVVSRASIVSHPPPLILIYPRVTRSYTSLKKPQHLVTVFNSFHYIHEGLHIFKLPTGTLKNTRSNVRFTRLKKVQQLVNSFTSFHRIFEAHLNLDLPLAMFTQTVLPVRYQH
jgi:hypothetical protein